MKKYIFFITLFTVSISFAMYVPTYIPEYDEKTCQFFKEYNSKILREINEHKNSQNSILKKHQHKIYRKFFLTLEQQNIASVNIPFERRSLPQKNSTVIFDEYRVPYYDRDLLESFSTLSQEIYQIKKIEMYYLNVNIKEIIKELKINKQFHAKMHMMLYPQKECPPLQNGEH